LDIDQASIISGQSATTTAEPEEIQALTQMALLVLQSLANSSSQKSVEDDDTHSVANSGVSVLLHVNTPPGKSGFMTVLREHDSIQWFQSKIVHNQDKPQIDQAVQNPDMLFPVVTGMVQFYSQILLPRHADRI